MNARLCAALFLCGVLFLCAGKPVHAQQATESSGAKSQHTHSADDHDAIMHRGEKGMGFSQTTTTHHFLLKPDGGVIAVSASDANDVAARDQIRMHLAHIAHSFSAGDFDIPMFIHDQEPPGVTVMKKRAKAIKYHFEATPAGGEVSISSPSPEAVQAVHDFLIYQIREHKTGDSTVLP